MVRATILALAGATSLISTAALAADLSPPVYRAPVESSGGWYLRGDVGVGIQDYNSFDFTQTNAATGGAWPPSWRIDVKDVNDTFFIGGGIGYAWNSWLRFDFTGEYRADVRFRSVGSYTEFCTSGRCFDAYDGNHSALVVLVNAYLDLGTWWCLTPFIGASVGGAYHRTASLTDVGHGLDNGGFPISVLGYADKDHTNWSFAWALHAGLAYSVTSTFKVEFAYRYLNMGNAETAEVLCGGGGCGNGNGPRAYYTLTNFDSHDFRIGMRWMLQQDTPVPLMRKG